MEASKGEFAWREPVWTIFLGEREVMTVHPSYRRPFLVTIIHGAKVRSELKDKTGNVGITLPP
jgi:hypothetical protein